MKNEVITSVIKSKIYKVRGQLVMLDSDLAKFYEQDTRVINQIRKRHEKAFDSQAFQLNKTELEELMRSQGVIPSNKRNKSIQPWVYTERGAYKISMFLTSGKAQIISETILDAFFYLKDKILNNPEVEYVTQREFQILSNQVVNMESEMKGLTKQQVINNYNAPVQINHGTITNVKNDNEMIYRLFELQKQVNKEPKAVKALDNAMEAVKSGNKVQIEKSIELLNKSADLVTKGSAAATVLGSAYQIMKVFFGF
jgi:hypothetical protein